MAKKRKRVDKWASLHNRNINYTMDAVDDIYDRAIARVVAMFDRIPKPELTEDGDLPYYYRVDSDHSVKTEFREIERQVAESLNRAIDLGLARAYILSEEKTRAMLRKYLGEEAAKIKITATDQHRATALKAFINGRKKDFDISGRAWNIAKQNTENLKQAIEEAMLQGTSANDLARDIKQYLNRPDELYRRVRGKDGRLHLSKRAREYHPGRGIYRSSYKNARRLAATEVNIAYRKAEMQNWQSSDIVVGIRVILSNNHTCLDDKGVPRPFTDICDDLKGEYPKDFNFIGWHPHCRCQAVPILKTEEECEADRESIRNGEPTTTDSVNKVDKMPPQFDKWKEGNSERIAKAAKKGTLPYFLRYNPKYSGRVH